jgi:hypothetical protein
VADNVLFVAKNQRKLGLLKKILDKPIDKIKREYVRSLAESLSQEALPWPQCMPERTTMQSERTSGAAEVDQ